MERAEAEASAADFPQIRHFTVLPQCADWRRAWGQGEFPFLSVQIAPFNWMPPEIREAQRLSLAKIPNSAMAVTLDVGDAEDIHPTDKRPVGERLALAARAIAYSERIDYSGPLFESLQIVGRRAVLKFSHVGGGPLRLGERPRRQPLQPGRAAGLTFRDGFRLIRGNRSITANRLNKSYHEPVPCGL